MSMDVRKFFFGLILGLTVGGVSAAWAVSITGDAEYIRGWSVVKDGEPVCSDPFMDPSAQEIQCD